MASAMTGEMDFRNVHVLLVEDNLADARLVREAFSEWTIPYNLHHVQDGVEAMAFLHREGKYADSITPDIVLLDLNLPRKDGRQVLSEIKGDPCLKCIPVVALTTSSASADIEACYQRGANAFVTKPMDFSRFVDVLTAVKEFWFSAATLPTRHCCA